MAEIHVVQELQKEQYEKKPRKILMTGKSGQGKSALINALGRGSALSGDQVAEEGAKANSKHRCTSEVKEYTRVLDGVSPVTVFDSPGLQDYCSTNLDMQNITDRCQGFDLIVYCTKMTDCRLANDDKHSMRTLTQAFGESIWEYSVIALTFANEVDCSRRDDRDHDTGLEPALDDEEGWKALEEKRFKGRLKIREEDLKEFFRKELQVSNEIVERISVVPTGDHRKPSRRNPTPHCLPGRDDWLKLFWLECCRSAKLLNRIPETTDGKQSSKQQDETEITRELGGVRKVLDEERRKLDGQRKEMDEERRKLDGERKEMDEERRKLDGERKEMDEERRKLDGERKEMDEERRKLDGERKEMDEERKKLDGERKEMDEERRKLDGERKEMDEERRKLDGQRKEMDEERRKLDGERKEMDEARKKLDGERKEMDEEKKKLDGERKEMDEERRKLDGERKEMDEERKKLDGERKEMDEARKKLDGERKEMDVARSKLDSTVNSTENGVQEDEDREEHAADQA